MWRRTLAGMIKAKKSDCQDMTTYDKWSVLALNQGVFLNRFISAWGRGNFLLHI